MKKTILSLLFFLSVFISGASMSFASDIVGKKIIIMGEGVTGTWAAAKISENLGVHDELIIVSPPKNEVVKNIGNGVFYNYTTSAFIPIGIQTELGPITLDPPSRQDIQDAQALDGFFVDAKLYVSPNLDKKTRNKLEIYSKEDPTLNPDKAKALIRYHRDVCFKGWKDYIEQGNKGADFTGTVILNENEDVLKAIREKVIRNRIAAGYAADDESLKVLDSKDLEKLLPYYENIINTHKLSGLVGLVNDGRVRGSDVVTSLNNKTHASKTQITRINAWVDSLKWHHDDHGNIVVTGIKLRDGKNLNADIVVSALGHGVEAVTKTAGIDLPILKKWGTVYALPQSRAENSPDIPVIAKRGLGIVRDVPGVPVNFGVGEWVLPEEDVPESTRVLGFVKESAAIWAPNSISKAWIKENPIYVQPRPMTLDGLPVLDSHIEGLIILNPSGSQGNTQAPGSANFAAFKVLEQLGRTIPDDLVLSESVDWKQFELYVNRF